MLLGFEKNRALLTWFIITALLLFTHTFNSTAYIMIILLFAFLYLVPVTLTLFAASKNIFFQLSIKYHYISAIFAGFSFMLPQGYISFIFALPWFFITLCIMLFGFTRIKSLNQSFHIPDLLVNAGLIYVIVGGIWLLLHRTGLPIMHFKEIIVLLTAIHFHFAAFITPIIFGITSRYWMDKIPKLRSFLNILGIFILIGPVWVAIGITFSQTVLYLEFIAVALFVIPLLIWAIAGIISLPGILPPKSAVYFRASLGSLIFSMLAAFIYGYEHLSHVHVLTIPIMVFVHGLVNCFGFSLCGLIGVQNLLNKQLDD